MAAHNGTNDTQTVVAPQKGGVKQSEMKRRDGQLVTPKQAAFIKGVAAGKSGTQAALDAYNTTSADTAKAIASENLSKPNVKIALQQALERSGLSIDRVAEVITDASNATRIASGPRVAIAPDGTATTIPGLVETDIPDHGTRLNAARLATQLMGAFDKDDDGSGKVTFNFGGNAKVYLKNDIHTADTKPQGPPKDAETPEVA
jgi:hypothetical protein